MITKSTGYTSSDGFFHATLEGAQKAELRILFHTVEKETDSEGDGWTVEEIANRIHKDADKFIDILTMKPNSLPKARKINGGAKKRKLQPTETTLPLEAK